MIKIGFIDYFLDEWHANNYSKFIKQKFGDEFKVAYAYAEIDKPNGKTTDEWCKEFDVERCNTIAEVVEKSDCIIVLSPDNPERHLDLCREPLASGKRVYVDKTFALTKDIAQQIVDIGEANNTAFFSTSALRFASELADVPRDGICFINSRGPGRFDTYAIHQIEPIVVLMGSNVERNRTKRIIRAGLEKARSHGTLKVGFLIVIAAREGAQNATSDIIARELIRAFERLDMFEKNAPEKAEAENKEPQ